MIVALQIAKSPAMLINSCKYRGPSPQERVTVLSLEADFPGSHGRLFFLIEPWGSL